MSKIFYGIGEVPPNKKLATMNEAIDANKVNYWGFCTVDHQLLKDKMDQKPKINKEQKEKDDIKLTSLEKKQLKLKQLQTKIETIEKQINAEKEIKQIREQKKQQIKEHKIIKPPKKQT